MRHASVEALRDAHCIIHPPPGYLILNKFNHASGVERSHRTPATAPWDNVVPERTSPRPACQIDQCSLWIVEGIRVIRHMGRADAEEPSNSVAVGEEPGFNRADGYAKAHLRSGIGKPPLDARRCAFAIPIEIGENNPTRMVCCGVVAAKRSE